MDQRNVERLISADRNRQQTGSAFFFSIASDNQAAQLRILWFLCPSAPTQSAQIIGIKHALTNITGLNRPLFNVLETTDYVSHRSVLGGTTGFTFTGTRLMAVDTYRLRGMFYQRGRITFVNIVDGARNTTAFAENSPAYEAEFSVDHLFAHAWYSASSMVSVFGINQRHDKLDPGLTGKPRLSWFGYHTGGINMAMGDGATRFVDEDIDDCEVLILSGIADGLVNEADLL